MLAMGAGAERHYGLAIFRILLFQNYQYKNQIANPYARTTYKILPYAALACLALPISCNALRA
jgi:hypothetical protein